MKCFKHTIWSLIATTLMVCCSDDFLEIKPNGVLQKEELANEEGLNKLLIGAYAILDGYLEDPNNTDNNLLPWQAAPSNWIYGNVVSDDAYKGSDPGDQPQANALENFTATS